MQRVMEGETPFISPVVSFMKATVPTKIISECGLQLCSQKGLWLYLLFAADYLSIYFSFYLKERDGDRKKYPSSGSFHKCLPCCSWTWLKAGDRNSSSVLSGYKGSTCFRRHLLSPRVHISRELESKVELGFGPGIPVCTYHVMS